MEQKDGEGRAFPVIENDKDGGERKKISGGPAMLPRKEQQDSEHV